MSDNLVYGLFAPQHRGENGCGVAVVKHGIRIKNIGPYAGIGHTLYEKSTRLQPIEKENNKSHIALAMDGTFLGLADIFFDVLNDTKDEIKATAKVTEELYDKGFYNAVVLVQGRDNTKLLAFRDPRGGKPLSFGKINNKYVASETQGLDPFVEDVKPGICLCF